MILYLHTILKLVQKNINDMLFKVKIIDKQLLLEKGYLINVRDHYYFKGLISS